MNQFIQDMIHLTEGEKLIKYWWLWLIMLGIFTGYLLIIKWLDSKKTDKQLAEEFREKYLYKKPNNDYKDK